MVLKKWVLSFGQHLRIYTTVNVSKYSKYIIHKALHEWSYMQVHYQFNKTEYKKKKSTLCNTFWYKHNPARLGKVRNTTVEICHKRHSKSKDNHKNLCQFCIEKLQGLIYIFTKKKNKKKKKFPKCQRNRRISLLENFTDCGKFHASFSVSVTCGYNKNITLAKNNVVTIIKW